MGKEETKQRAKRTEQEILQKLARAERELQEAQRCANIGLLTNNRTPDKRKYNALDAAVSEIGSISNSLSTYKSELRALGIDYCLNYNLKIIQNDFNRVYDVYHQNRGAGKMAHDNIDMVLRELDKLRSEVLKLSHNINYVEINERKNVVNYERINIENHEEKKDERAELKQGINAYINAVKRMVNYLNFYRPLCEIEERIQVDLLEFMLYLSIPYSKISEAQLHCIEETVDIKLSSEKAEFLIQGNGINQPEFEKRVPESYKVLFEGYKKLVGNRPDLVKNQAFGAVVITYVKIGEVFINANTENNLEAVKKCETYIDMLKRFPNENLKDYNIRISF